ncbi:hypothetical protein JOF53_004563 [Crossiella equi]|uniref:Uncharacterized protein n=1 Tax=Crossiella equi TaxID=130796 RepID=A0ABS5AGI1_9PSEU|nr:hypothetical protein [Crossiella equi]MBP2475691.1 hypothetical protein [Crossiella equi]
MEELRTVIVAPPGGVMTEDVGVVTGDLELVTRCQDSGDVEVLVRYDGADEYYKITGADTHLHDPKDHEPLHRTLAAVLNRPEG